MNLSLLQRKIQEVCKRCHRDPASINLIAVSKGHTIEEILSVYKEGCIDFGENRIQEFEKKLLFLPQELKWHFIGTLQKNKVKKAIGCFTLIHSVDNPELLREIDRRSSEANTITDVLLQANTSSEMSKHGLTPEEWLIQFDKNSHLKNVKLSGWMTMASLHADEQAIRKSFKSLRQLKNKTGLHHLSMGMSSDFEIAIEEGATILRIGSLLFDNFK